MPLRNPANKASTKALKSAKTPPPAAKSSKTAKSASKSTETVQRPTKKAVQETVRPAPAPKAPKRGRKSALESAAELLPAVARRLEPAVMEGAGLVNGGVYEAPPGSVMSDPSDPYDDSGLRKTTTPGVYINRAGVLVDADGIMLDFKTVQQRDAERFERVIGEKVDTPAKFLKAVALDPLMPLPVRIECAKSAAPYTDRKKPIGIDGGEDGKPIGLIDVSKMRGMTADELQQMKLLLMKASTQDATDVEVNQ